jgi:hypothetical protein
LRIAELSRSCADFVLDEIRIRQRQNGLRALPPHSRERLLQLGVVGDIKDDDFPLESHGPGFNIWELQSRCWIARIAQYVDRSKRWDELHQYNRHNQSRPRSWRQDFGASGARTR